MNFAEQLLEATAKRDAARYAMDTATTRKALTAAIEELDFWMGKVAYLEAAVAA